MDREQALAELRRIVNAAKDLGNAVAALESTLGDGLLSVQAIPLVPPKVEHEEEWLNPKDAAWQAKVHASTMRRWADNEVQYPGLSRSKGGRLEISPSVLRQVIAGELPLPSKRAKGC